jgi:hypothetical protein
VSLAIIGLVWISALLHIIWSEVPQGMQLLASIWGLSGVPGGLRRMVVRLGLGLVTAVMMDDDDDDDDRLSGIGVELSSMKPGLKENTIVCTVKSHNHNIPMLLIEYLNA